jgi:hypothetical protein
MVKLKLILTANGKNNEQKKLMSWKVRFLDCHLKNFKEGVEIKIEMHH